MVREKGQARGEERGEARGEAGGEASEVKREVKTERRASGSGGAIGFGVCDTLVDFPLGKVGQLFLLLLLLCRWRWGFASLFILCYRHVLRRENLVALAALVTLLLLLLGYHLDKLGAEGRHELAASQTSLGGLLGDAAHGTGVGPGSKQLPAQPACGKQEEEEEVGEYIDANDLAASGV